MGRDRSGSVTKEIDMRNQGDRGYINVFVDGLDPVRRIKCATTIIKGRERQAINERRLYNYEKAGKPDRRSSPVTGLALSGGGIRSASIGLGALQAIHSLVGIEGVDYLSTVSGGGYIGSSLVAGLTTDAREKKPNNLGVFPFLKRRNDFGDSESVRHIRDFSKYLIPHGIPDVVTAFAIFLRGLVANLILLAPFIFLSVAIILYNHPSVDTLDQPGRLIRQILSTANLFLPHVIERIWKLDGFWATSCLLYIDFLVLILWTYWKSLTTSTIWRQLVDFLGSFFTGPDSPGSSVRQEIVEGRSYEKTNFQKDQESDELSGPWPNSIKILFTLTAIAGWLELQPHILHHLELKHGVDHAQGWIDKAIFYLTKALDQIVPLLAPLGAVMAFFSKFIGDTLTFSEHSTGRNAIVKKTLSTVAMWFVGLTIPAFVWYIHLKLTYFSLIGIDSKLSHYLQTAQQQAAAILQKIPLISFFSDYVSKCTFSPELLGSICAGNYAVYLSAFILSGLLALLVNPNATTFFRLYRDRLNKAFIFNPDPLDRDELGDLKAISIKLHKILTTYCPYPIINASLNLQGSKFANKRGRNADFFVFTPEYVGSPATGYIGSRRIFLRERDLDLGTAMTISAAAVSPNMGSATIKPLVATLALLNVRLGYWLINPRYVDKFTGPIGIVRELIEGCRRSFYLLYEIFGALNEYRTSVYLTDGGNLENLGLYELLRRKCDVIIAVDSEADPNFDFPSLIKLTRFARTDLGVRIDLPWEEIRSQALKTNNYFIEAAKKNDVFVPKNPGPHCAVCDIEYSDGEKGLLFYFKSSLSGDENDLVFDYKRRYPDFPHQTTIDQFFGEDQLEAYRSLGFHMVKGVISGEKPFAIRFRQGETEEQARLRAYNTLIHAMGGLQRGHAGSDGRETTPPIDAEIF